MSRFNTFLNIIVLTLGLWNLSFCDELPKKHHSFAMRQEVQSFMAEMQKKHGFDPKTLNTYFKAFNTNPTVIALMNKQFEALPWYRYEERIVTQKRIRSGVKFWQENQKALALAEAHFGVPAEMIVAIIGVETSYGQVLGKFPVLQTLATLAFDYPRRSHFFKQELEHFLLLCKEGAVHPRTALGSYAGAMGLPQFMPSSYRQYAIDFSGTGKRQLLSDTTDVIGSVGNYLKKHGWQQKAPVIKKIKNPEAFQTYVNTAHQKQKIRLVTLEGPRENKEYWIGLPNFNVIMRYNNSAHYSMAVYRLSERILAEYSRHNDA
jgi:membrane-bound lytic murein transglycosylase B